MDKENKNIFDSKEIQKNLISESNIHINTSQEVIITTEDKIRLYLQKHLDNMTKKNTWQTPAGIALTILITLITTDFKGFWFIKPDTWFGMFLCFLFVFATISIASFLKFRKSDSSIEEVVKDIKGSSFRTTVPLTTDNEPTFLIKEAKYGVENKYKDVTQLLQGMVNTNSLTVTASNALAGDPFEGKVKQLLIRYSFNGKDTEKIVNENDTITLP